LFGGGAWLSLGLTFEKLVPWLPSDLVRGEPFRVSDRFGEPELDDGGAVMGSRLAMAGLRGLRWPGNPSLLPSKRKGLRVLTSMTDVPAAAPGAAVGHQRPVDPPRHAPRQLVRLRKLVGLEAFLAEAGCGFRAVGFTVKLRHDPPP
jgi:hypothetical protein